jgi:Holliday junction resolvasome RuvABC ATP-dependent DNA helicase subunit
MVVITHAVEAYVLNPVIYSGMSAFSAQVFVGHIFSAVSATFAVPAFSLIFAF